MSAHKQSEPGAQASSIDPSTSAGGEILDSGAHAVEGWVTAAPPRWMEIALHILMAPRLLVRHWDLIKTSVWRELQARFTGTVLGWAWPLLTPVLMFLIYYFIFTNLLSSKMPDLPPELDSVVGIYMFTGVLVWTAFAESITRGTNVIVENGNLIKKVAFPTEILPLNLVLVNLVTMAFGLAMFLLACLVLPIWPAQNPLDLCWVPLLLLLQAIFSYGVTLVLATMQVYLRDTMQVVAVAATVWMFITPIFWVPEFIPDMPETMLEFVRVNPMYHLLYSWRVVLMSETPDVIFNGDMQTSLGIFALWALGSFVFGYGFFLAARRRFADEI